MQFSLEFTATPTDWRELWTAMRTRRFSPFRLLAAALVLFLCWHRYVTTGVDWILGLYVAIAIYFAIWEFLFIRLLMSLLLTIWRTSTCVSITGDSVCTQQGKYQQEIRWTSLAMTGKARELDKHFLLECGRGNVWIP